MDSDVEITMEDFFITPAQKPVYSVITSLSAGKMCNHWHI